MSISAGAASVELPLAAGLPLGGYASRASDATGFSGPLTARALVLDCAGSSFVIVAYDLLYATADLTAAVRDAVAAGRGISADRVLVCATHTHCGPRDLTDRTDPGLVALVAEAGKQAVQDASAAMRPVRVVSGVAGSLGIGRNRREGTGPVDDEAQLLLLEELDSGTPTGRVVATVVNLACHPTVLEGDTVSYNPDFVGPLREAVEAALGGVCLFLQGFAGSTNPVFLDHSVADARRVGATAAAPIVQELARILSTGREASVINLSEGREVPVSVPEGLRHDGPLRVGTVRVQADRNDRSREPAAGAPEPARRAEQWARQLFRDGDPVFNTMDVTDADPGPIRLEIQVATLGDDLALVALPGEPFGSARDRIVEQLPGARVLTIGYANGAPAYLPDREAFAASGYEVGASFVAPGTAERLADEAVALLRASLTADDRDAGAAAMG